jgi:branched-subunit amino acid aminotransferase/4-amino-4-deoxychorismate lyase
VLAELRRRGFSIPRLRRLLTSLHDIFNIRLYEAIGDGGPMTIYLNGSYVDAKDAMISVEDRGFFFADGVYEVIRVYEGKPFLMDAHMLRLRAGLAALHIAADAVATLNDIAAKLINDNGLLTGDATIYIQITRGVAPRKHYGYSAIAMALTLLLLVREPVREVRTRVCAWQVMRDTTSSWPTLRR